MEKGYYSPLEQSASKSAMLSRRDALKGLAGLVLGATGLTQESYGQEKKTYSYEEFENTLKEHYQKQRKKLMFIDTESKKKFENTYEELDFEEKKILTEAYSKPFSQTEKEELKEFIQSHPWEAEEKERYSKNFPWNVSFEEIGPLSRIKKRYYIRIKF